MRMSRRGLKWTIPGSSINWDGMRRFLRFIEKRYKPGQMLIWCGDLNVAPENIDVHNPKRLLGHVDFNPEVWDAFTRIKKWGLVDVFRRFHPGEPNQYTFYDYRVPGSVEKALGWRVDHILATCSLTEKCTQCYIDMQPRLMEKSSDHTVMVADFRI